MRVGVADSPREFLQQGVAIGTQDAIDLSLVARACQVVRQAVWLHDHGITEQERMSGGILDDCGARNQFAGGLAAPGVQCFQFKLTA